MNEQQDPIVETLARALEDARQGKIRSAVLMTMNAEGGGYWARINADEDNEAAKRHVAALQHDLSLRPAQKTR